ncbi:hypothetical protein KOW79_018008 [Hemibagrus wyckioides]|uniref:G-protein coupled receptors family 1 profile domain-containing protein n=1 Tax=Hemibagrus wyckioides TaxID=337641 RepID=A0A9D3NBH4_9TELE|nr:hypothetical protein KOW79_018008 [Hemibagrus wyckioides]
MQQLNSTNSSFNAPVSAENMIASSVLAVFVILGVPGNIAVMVRLAGWLKRGSFTPRLMLSLAVSDLLTLISLPVWIWALLRGWIFGLVLCKLLSYVVYLNLYCSILCVMLMSMQRYMQVLHPEKWNKLGIKEKKILLIEPTLCYTKALTMQQLNSSNSSLTAPASTEILIASSVLGVCFILGVPGNITVMVRLAGWLKTDSFTPRLMLSLAVSV